LLEWIVEGRKDQLRVGTARKWYRLDSRGLATYA
jgi:hypothetical protein